MTAGHDRQPGVRHERAETLAEGTKLPIALAHHHEHRHAELAQPAPQRLHLARTDAPQRGRQRVWPVAAVLLTREHVHLMRVCGEQRLAAPALDEALEGNPLEFVGQPPVGLAALGSLGGVGDTGRARDQHESRHASGRRERQLQGDPATERVARQREALGRARQHVLDASREGDRRFLDGLTVPGQVERQRQVALRAHARRDPVPRVPGAGEAVQQNQGLPHVAILVSVPALAGAHTAVCRRGVAGSEPGPA